MRIHALAKRPKRQDSLKLEPAITQEFEAETFAHVLAGSEQLNSHNYLVTADAGLDSLTDPKDTPSRVRRRDHNEGRRPSGSLFNSDDPESAGWSDQPG
uniref:Uncharacterized protein n=1 Tax=Coccidioides posadasii RMSCC 3488 TaxID=454284 RepID=A0A0J6FSX2_COCPO|nr:hypothetical protein CPAG_08458 [Coccidioides posadasii RMSCC 3488]